MSTLYAIRHENLRNSHVTGSFSATIGGINQSRALTIQFDGVDSTHVRATFPLPVMDNPAIRCTSLWELIPPMGGVAVSVLSVDPEQTPETTSVLLTTTEHKNLAGYTGTLYFLELA